MTGFANRFNNPDSLSAFMLDLGDAAPTDECKAVLLMQAKVSLYGRFLSKRTTAIRSKVPLITRDIKLQNEAEYARLPFLEPPVKSENFKDNK